MHITKLVESITEFAIGRRRNNGEGPNASSFVADIEEKRTAGVANGLASGGVGEATRHSKIEIVILGSKNDREVGAAVEANRNFALTDADIRR